MDASLAPYHQQHQELLRLASQYESRLEAGLVRRHPEACLAAVQRLVGLTKAHLAQEHTILYPALLADRNADVQTAARDLEAGLQELSGRLREFGRHWTSAQTIGLAPEAFIRNARELFRVLRNRIEAETTGLFPLVERT